jgi:hypothetical protein
MCDERGIKMLAYNSATDVVIECPGIPGITEPHPMTTSKSNLAKASPDWRCQPCTSVTL